MCYYKPADIPLQPQRRIAPGQDPYWQQRLETERSTHEFDQQLRHIAADLYLDAAKRRNKHLKTLKSVSRAYRKGEVRSIKLKAIRKLEGNQ